MFCVINIMFTRTADFTSEHGFWKYAEHKMIFSLMRIFIKRTIIKFEINIMISNRTKTQINWNVTKINHNLYISRSTLQFISRSTLRFISRSTLWFISRSTLQLFPGQPCGLSPGQPCSLSRGQPSGLSPGQLSGLSPSQHPEVYLPVNPAVYLPFTQ